MIDDYPITTIHQTRLKISFKPARQPSLIRFQIPVALNELAKAAIPDFSKD